MCVCASTRAWRHTHTHTILSTMSSSQTQAALKHSRTAPAPTHVCPLARVDPGRLLFPKRVPLRMAEVQLLPNTLFTITLGRHWDQLAPSSGAQPQALSACKQGQAKPTWARPPTGFRNSCCSSPSIEERLVRDWIVASPPTLPTHC